jgi:anti-sigma factor RsiW
MSDMAERLSPEQMADLSALADGTLPAERRAEVEARVAASPELQELLERQRRAVLAARTLAEEQMPVSLQAAVEAQARRRRARRARSRRHVPRLVLVGVGVVAGAVVGAIVLTGGPGAPSVADAARFATKPPTAPAPPPAGKAGTKLALAVDGVHFPNLRVFAGWHAVGARQERLGNRDASLVVYSRNGKRLGYVIVAGGGLARPSGAQATSIRGVEYQTLPLSGRLAVTWRRGGRTCVLTGQATRRELLRLASWPLTPPRR